MSVTTEDVITRLPGFCSCGLQMVPHGGLLLCSNCDTVQDQQIRCADCGKPGECQAQPGKRIFTERDWAFQKVWRRRIQVLFPSKGGHP